jgi:large subunit ribosomal protein L30
MILIIRISGMVEVPTNIQEALFRLRLRKKYSAVLIKDSEENKNLLQLIRDYVAYGTIDSATLNELVSKRAKSIKAKLDVKKVVSDLESKGFSDDIKPFFSLHSPRGGIDSKIHFGRKKGVLGDNKEKINLLVRRML